MAKISDKGILIDEIDAMNYYPGGPVLKMMDPDGATFYLTNKALAHIVSFVKHCYGDLTDETIDKLAKG